MRRLAALIAAAATGLSPLSALGTAAGAGLITAVTAAVAAAPARAAASGSVLILGESVNGGSASAEAKAVPAGYTVTVASSSTWDAMTSSQFAAYSAIIIGDPSAGSCSATVPPDALSTAATWGAAVTGNVAVVGTAPALAGSAGTSLISDAIGYAVAGGGAGLYISLNCENSASAAGTAVGLLAAVDGGGFTVAGQGSSCPDSGTVNSLEADEAAQFSGLKSAALASWASPACSVRETFDSWPAGFTPVAYDAAAAPADFTASDGAAGQPYVLLGAPVSSATQALAPSTGGEVPAGAFAGGSNPADAGLSQASAGDPVNTENGDFTQSATDLSVPTFGPSLDFTRTYDALAAQQQMRSGTPGSMGYGWTDSFATSITAAKPVPGDIYTLDGLATDNGQGGPAAHAAINQPGAVFRASTGTYIADSGGNRVEEIPASSGTQWGQSMVAGDIYTIAGRATGVAGASGNGTTAGSSLLDDPQGVTIDQAGNLFIADTGNNRVVEIPATSGTQWGHIAMTAGDLYVVAGTGSAGLGADGVAATSSALDMPQSIAVMPAGGPANDSLFIPDSWNNRIQEVAATTGSQWGQSMTAGDVYTVAGSSAGTAGDSGEGGPATGAELNGPYGVALSTAGDLYVSDTGNQQVLEVAAATGTQWGQISMTKFDIYTIAGNGEEGPYGDGGPATSASLWSPEGLVSGNGQQLYIADYGDDEIREIARTAHTEWGQAMTAGDIYTVAGQLGAPFSQAGDGGPASAALLWNPSDVTLDTAGDLIIADTENNEIREISAATDVISDLAGDGGFGEDGDAGSAVNAGLLWPASVLTDALGDILIADASGNRIQEIAATSHTQFGIAMSAGDVYTVAGQATGYWGDGADGEPATSSYLWTPSSIALDAAGNLYISDVENNRVQEVSAATGVITTFAGTGTWGNDGDGGPAADADIQPQAIAFDTKGDLYIADYSDNQIREVAAVTGSQWGQNMTVGDIYTIAGDPDGTGGITGDGGPAGSALLQGPDDIAFDAAGNLYFTDSGNNRVQELAATTHMQYGQAMTQGDMYTVAGSAAGTWGNSGIGGPATAAILAAPGAVTVDAAGDMYIDSSTGVGVLEVAAANGTQRGQLMTAGDIYNVAGSAAGTSGDTGDGGPATSATFEGVAALSIDPAGDLLIGDAGLGTGAGHLREVSATATSAVAQSPIAGGLTVTQGNGSQVTFYAKSAGSCAAPYIPAGGYCALPQYKGAALTFNAGAGTYTYTQSPAVTYTYENGGALESEIDAAGDTLTVSYGSPLPGAGHCPSTAHLCDTVTAASGRTLVLGYSAALLVTSVTDPAGRTWIYAYNSADQLTSATDPMGHVTSYTYGPGPAGGPLLASDLLTITTPNAQPGGPDAGHSTVNVYDSSGRVISQTDPMGHTTGFNYCVNAADGDCMNGVTGNGTVTVTDPDGNTTVDDYQQGALAAQSLWTGSTLTSERDQAPDVTAGGNAGGTLQPTSATDGAGNTATYTYDPSGNMTSVTSPDGLGGQTATTSAWYTALDKASCKGTAEAATPCSSTETGPAPVAPGGVITPPSAAPPSGVTYILYDTNGNQLYATAGDYPPGSQTASGEQTSYTLYKGNSVTLGSTNVSCTATPPAPSLPCAQISPNGAVTQLGYDAQGDLTSASTPDGNGSQLSASTYGYDGDGEQTSAIAPDGNLAGANSGNYTTVTAYNNDGDKTSVTQAGGTGATVTPRTTSFGYDADRNQTTVTDPRGYLTTTGYNGDDQATLVTDPSGNATLSCFDGDGNLTQTVPPAGVAVGSLTPSSCPSSYPSGYGHRLASDATTWTYNAAGQKTAMTTPAPAGQTQAQTTTYSYDGAGNLTKTVAPPASGTTTQVTVTTWNTADRPASTTTGYGTAAASTASYCYDPNGDQTSYVMPDGNTTAVAPCETSSPWAVSATADPTQAAYQTTSAYNSVGELTSVTTPATSAAANGATTSYTYDADGNALASTDPNGITATWTYTPQDQPATTTYSGSSAHSVSYTYDADGAQTSMSDATGTTTATYDPFDDLTAATNGAGKTVSYSYDADGNTTAITYPLPATATWATTPTVSYGYNHADVLTSVTDFNGHQITITPNADSLPATIGLGGTGDTITDTYDPTDTPSAITLANSTTTLQSFSYAHAPAGNITTETDTPSSSRSPASYTYDAKSRVTSMTPGTGSALNYGFDASGNLTTLPGGATSTYDHDSELTSAVAGSTTTSYTYDPDGHRLTAKQGSATISSANWNGAGQLTSYDNSSADMTAATYDGAGQRATATTGGTTQNFTWDNTGDLLMDSANAYIYDGGQAPAEQVSLATGAITFLSTDLLGSVRGTISATGALTASTSYDAWGNPQTTGGLTSSTPFGYAGAYTDTDGLLYLINRYYDPATGQFTSLDPDVSTTHGPYAYAAGNPVTGTDPTGLTVMFIGGTAGGTTCTVHIPGCPGYVKPAPTIIFTQYPQARPTTHITAAAPKLTPILVTPVAPPPPEYIDPIPEPIPGQGIIIDPIPPEIGGTISDPIPPDIGLGGESYPIGDQGPTIYYNLTLRQRLGKKLGEAFLEFLLLLHVGQQHPGQVANPTPMEAYQPRPRGEQPPGQSPPEGPEPNEPLP